MSHGPTDDLAPPVPDWARGHEASIAYHANMLADTVRMDAFERALRTVIRPGDVVLDLGCGTGVLAMLAARAGASRVHAVESMPVADLARHLVARNGLSDRVKVHYADALEMAPIEPVDVVVSEFLGRFVVDDGMFAVVSASAAWLKPDGRFCPHAVTMRMAPVHLASFPALDVFDVPVVGLDMSLAGYDAQNHTYGVELPLHAMLADGLDVHRMEPPETGLPIEAELAFTIRRGGRLRGLAAWFEAELAAGVSLTNGPGATTHWGQMLLPLPATAVRVGDRLTVRFIHIPGTLLGWCWQGEVRRGEELLTSFDLRADGWIDPPATKPPLERLSDDEITAIDAAGADAAHAGNLEAAAMFFERAVLSVSAADGDRVRRLNANLGAVYALMGRHRDAVAPLLRALDGDVQADEQAARLLVDALFSAGLTAMGATWLRRYETAFGPHPAGWAHGSPGSASAAGD